MMMRPETAIRRAMQHMLFRQLAIFLACAAISGCASSRSYLPDRSGQPLLLADIVEVVADLPEPPGNIAISRDDRIFFTFHPEADPEIRVAELVDGQAVPFPDKEFQIKHPTLPSFDTVLSVRIDGRNWLWTLDHGDFGRGRPRLMAFDIQTGKLIHQYDFPPDIAGFGSFLNDFQVTLDGDTIFIADTGAPFPVFGGKPAIVIYDLKTRSARKVLVNHPSVRALPHVVRVEGKDLAVLGIPIRIGLDSIALDRGGQWLYYGALNGETLYRISTEHLLNPDITDTQLGAMVETYASKTMSDGITTDLAGNIYLSDMENSAVHIITPDRNLQTLLKDPRFRWPDGFSFGPGGWLYFTCSDLMNVIGKRRSHIADHAPYQIYRFRPGHDGIPGH